MTKTTDGKTTPVTTDDPITSKSPKTDITVTNKDPTGSPSNPMEVKVTVKPKRPNDPVKVTVTITYEDGTTPSVTVPVSKAATLSQFSVTTWILFVCLNHINVPV